MTQCPFCGRIFPETDALVHYTKYHSISYTEFVKRAEFFNELYHRFMMKKPSLLVDDNEKGKKKGRRDLLREKARQKDKEED